MPIYEYECTECGNIETYFANSITEGQMVAYMQCSECGGLCKKIISTGHFRVTGANAKNGYTSAPRYDDVIDANGYAKKEWGKK